MGDQLFRGGDVVENGTFDYICRLLEDAGGGEIPVVDRELLLESECLVRLTAIAVWEDIVRMAAGCDQENLVVECAGYMDGRGIIGD